MTHSRESRALRDAQLDETDALACAVRVALAQDPSRQRLSAAHERLLSAVDAQATPRISDSSPLSLVRNVWWIGIGVVALAIVVEFAPRSSAPSGVRDPAHASVPVVVSPQLGAAPPTARAVESASVPAEPVRPALRKPSRAIAPQPLAAPNVSELELLRAAQHALPDAPAAALLRLQEHRAAYPHGLLEQERELLAIEVALAMHQPNRALRLAHAFAATFPHSAHLRRLQRMLATVGKTFSPDGNMSDPEPLMKGSATTESQDHVQE